jgi:superfamily II DNA/RNA helicase
VDKFRLEKEITIIKNRHNAPNPVMAFNEVDFPRKLQERFSKAGFESPTAI